MFQVIGPKFHHQYTTLINKFLEPLKENKELKTSFSKIKDSHFILMDDKVNGIYGGAIILKNKKTSLHRLLSKYVLSSMSADVWTSFIYLSLNHENVYYDIEPKCTQFYNELYLKLREFGKTKKFNYLYVKLMPGEYFCTEVLGSWIYVFEIPPQESQDGLFHGVLSLKESKTK